MGFEKPRSKRQELKNAFHAALAAAAVITAVPEEAKAQGLSPYDIGGTEHTQSKEKKMSSDPAIGEAWASEIPHGEAAGVHPVMAEDGQHAAEYLAVRESFQGAHIRFTGKEVRWHQYEEFCKEIAIYCEKFAHPIDTPQEQEMSPETLTRIYEINRGVATEVIPELDEKLYGVSEKWTIPGVAGDCEDIVLLKMIRLIDAGIDPSRLHILVVVKKENKEGHAVLGVDVRSGGKMNTLILDNLTDDIVTLDRMELAYAAIYASFISRVEDRLEVRFFQYEKAAQ